MSDDFDRGDFFDDNDFGDAFGENDFGDDFGDDFGTDDDFAADFGAELGDEGADMPDFDFGDEEPEERRTLFGLNRTFVIIIGVVAIILCVGIIGLLVVISQTAGPSDVEYTVTAVLATNTAVADALNLTATRNAITNTPTPTLTPSDTPTLTNTPTNTVQPTIPTQTPLFVTPTSGGEGVADDALAMTATAIAQQLLATPTGAGGEGAEGTPGALDATPTPEEGDGTGDDGGVLFVTTTPSSELPDTGLFDDIGQEGGVNGLLTAGLVVLGLVGVIVVARRLRGGM
ncbi:MAG: hypothetical protein JW910_15840 [Anaerolineae bacterium]|nr:hypothetical protein [Anaerolineae bacterium]